MTLLKFLELIENEYVDVYQLNSRGNQEIVYSGILGQLETDDSIVSVSISEDDVISVYLDDPLPFT